MPALVVGAQHARLEEPLERLQDEHRVAAGAPVQLRREGGRPLGPPHQVGDQGLHAARGDRAHGDLGELTAGPPRRQRLAQVAGDLTDPVRADHPQAAAGQVAEGLERRGVRPLEVVDRQRRRGGRDEAGERFDQAAARGRGVERGGHQAGRHLRHQAREVLAVRPEPLGQLGARPDERGERVVGQPLEPLDRPADEGVGPCLAQQRRLADARLAGEHHDGGARLAQRPPFGVAADEPRRMERAGGPDLRRLPGPAGYGHRLAATHRRHEREGRVERQQAELLLEPLGEALERLQRGVATAPQVQRADVGDEDVFGEGVEVEQPAEGGRRGLEAAFGQRRVGRAHRRAVESGVQPVALRLEPGVDPADVVRGEALEQRAAVERHGGRRVAGGERAPELGHVAGDRPAHRVAGRLERGLEPHAPHPHEQLPQRRLGGGLVGLGPEEQRQAIALDPAPLGREQREQATAPVGGERGGRDAVGEQGAAEEGRAHGHDVLPLPAGARAVQRRSSTKSSYRKRPVPAATTPMPTPAPCAGGPSYTRSPAT